MDVWSQFLQHGYKAIPVYSWLRSTFLANEPDKGEFRFRRLWQDSKYVINHVSTCSVSCGRICVSKASKVLAHDGSLTLLLCLITCYILCEGTYVVPWSVQWNFIHAMNFKLIHFHWYKASRFLIIETVQFLQRGSAGTRCTWSQTVDMQITHLTGFSNPICLLMRCAHVIELHMHGFRVRFY